MAYLLEFTESARKELAHLDKSVLQDIRNRLLRLAEVAETMTHRPLKGEFAGLYKMRAAGKYRVIYDLQRDTKRIVVIKVGNRNDIYKE